MFYKELYINIIKYTHTHMHTFILAHACIYTYLHTYIRTYIHQYKHIHIFPGKYLARNESKYTLTSNFNNFVPLRSGEDTQQACQSIHHISV